MASKNNKSNKAAESKDSPSANEVTGTHLYQQCPHCGGWDTTHSGTKTDEQEDCKVIVRQRRCKDCEQTYAHNTVWKKVGTEWVESGSGFCALPETKKAG